MDSQANLSMLNKTIKKWRHLVSVYENNLLFGESSYRLMTKNGQFIYMSTRGRLDVDPQSGAVTSFVCTNTVVDEREGEQLIKRMKERFTLSDVDDVLSIEDTNDVSMLLLNGNGHQHPKTWSSLCQS